MPALNEQFRQALTRIEVNGHKKQRAIEAHTEIQGLLAQDLLLQTWGINTRLIGSYGRQTAIYPGKDVDVFARLENLNTAVSPQDVYNGVWAVLVAEYGSVDQGGRATPQARSIKIDFSDPSDRNASFAVDVVPAVRQGERWAIPTKDRDLWVPGQTRWVTTDPERFGELSSLLNAASFSPTVGGQGAYKPVVKLMRQAREVHLKDQKPGGLYVEFAVFDIWANGRVGGNEWGPLFAATLREAAQRFASAVNAPLLDPGLGTPVDPPLDAAQWAHASETFHGLAELAAGALNTDRCNAALKWRRILGKNDRGDVFPLPPGCSGAGPAPAGLAGAGLAGVAAGRPKEAQGFG
ncbi:MAG: nucleotidyltransferase [Acidimicrobiaceae bacterium]|nr:nucleotidyltransferase [Acidimicrobiaceae bacterium]MYD01813.1 nucleotidyltransferase [Gammaproteobacteria bacterium]MYI54969.1 nucleotidyltransferase [Acidimicrobiaceae bacterium]